jgi:hypothetical protein
MLSGLQRGKRQVVVSVDRCCDDYRIDFGISKKVLKIRRRRYVGIKAFADGKSAGIQVADAENASRLAG